MLVIQPPFKYQTAKAKVQAATGRVEQMRSMTSGI
jgi:hypothetical protein